MLLDLEQGLAVGIPDGPGDMTEGFDRIAQNLAQWVSEDGEGSCYAKSIKIFLFFSFPSDIGWVGDGMNEMHRVEGFPKVHTFLFGS